MPIIAGAVAVVVIGSAIGAGFVFDEALDTAGTVMFFGGAAVLAIALGAAATGAI